MIELGFLAALQAVIEGFDSLMVHHLNAPGNYPEENTAVRLRFNTLLS